jgi:hypothetical protein
MRTYIVTVLLGILLLTSCTPTTTPTSVAVLPTATPTDAPADTPTNTPPPTIIVTSSADSGPGTLRQAMQDVQPGYTITFDPAVFPPHESVTIFISGELPHINMNNMTLDASNAGVILDGSQVPGDWTAGLQIVSSEGNTIMGLQISHFPGPGIAISGDSKHNVIGGDRNVGAGPWGQGNLISNNLVGVDLSTENTTLNTITGNLIGIDLEGSDWLGNERDGVSLCEAAHDNTIGPDNIIANNGRLGVNLEQSETLQNTVTQNSIYDNGVGKGKVAGPVIFDFNLSEGTITGATCSYCTVEIFSTSSNEKELFEDQTTADENGVFTFDKGAPFTGPYLLALTTDVYGQPGEFGWLTSGAEGSVVLQQGNELPKTQFLSKMSSSSADNHIATQYDGISTSEDLTDLSIYKAGVTRARVSMAGLEPELVDWDKPELSISQAQDDHFNRMADKDIIVTYVLMFWDKETYPGGEGAPCARFKTEGEIERWLEYVRFTVDHLKDRVQYFEIWNEPDIRNYCPKWIELDDYINLIRLTVPVIRDVAPEAKIVVGAVSGISYSDAYNYLLGLLGSEVMPLVDVISWHPMYGASPELNLFRNYYYNYPTIVQEIKDTAAANGFVGEYHADELTWRTEVKEDQPGVYSPIAANKYFSRAAIMHRGMDIDIGLGSGYYVIRRLSTAMAGVEPTELPILIQSIATNIVSYTFSLDDGGYMVGLWTNGIAVEDDPGVETTVTIPGFSASEVIGIDILENCEQELVTEMENGDLVINNLMVKDYPILIKFIDTTP